MNYIKTKNKERYPVIVMGDFNAVPKSFVIQNIRNKSGLQSVTDKNSILYNEGTRVGFKNREKGHYIDYIFICNSYEVEEVELVKYNINGQFPSDHIPLYTQIKKI